MSALRCRSRLSTVLPPSELDSPHRRGPIRPDQEGIVAPKQDVITRDNVSVAVNAVVYVRVLEPIKAINQVQNSCCATAQLSQIALRSVAGEAEMDDLLGERERINRRLQGILDQHTDRWGIKVTQVELKDIDLPVEMKRAMAAEDDRTAMT